MTVARTKEGIFLGLTQRAEGPCRDPISQSWQRGKERGRFSAAFFFFLILLSFTIPGRYLLPFPRWTSLGEEWEAEEARALLINRCFCGEQCRPETLERNGPSRWHLMGILMSQGFQNFNT